MKPVGESQIPPFLRSRSFGMAILRIRQVTLYICVVAGLFALCFVAWYFFAADPSQFEDPADGPQAPLSRKIYAVAFVLVWNVLVFWTLVGDKRKLERLRAEKIVEQ